jgi:hypothetical protein
MTNEPEKLPRLLEKAASTLADATTAAEFLDARDLAGVAYTAARKLEQLAKVKDAHDTVRAACHKVMGEALIIEAQAQCRLADEYDGAQQRGEVRAVGQRKQQNIPQENISRTVADIGLTSKQVHEFRITRDAERRKPGIVRKAVDEKLRAGRAPTRADVWRALTERKAPPPTAMRDLGQVLQEREANRAPASQPSQPAVAPDSDHAAPAESDTNEIDHAIDVILDHLQTLDDDRQMRFVDHILLPIGLASRQLSRRDKLTWQPGSEGSYTAAIMKETRIPYYFVYPSDETDEALYEVSICFPDHYEILVGDDKEPLPLAEAKKFAEARHAERVDYS